MKKLLIFVVTASIVMVSTGGFYDAREIAHTVTVIAMGIDKGETMPYRVTFQIERTGTGEGAASGENSGNETEKEKSKDVLIVEAPTILSAFARANSINSVDLSMNNVKMVIISSEVAENGIKDAVCEIASATEFKNNAYLALSLKKAEDILKNVSPEDEEYLSVYYEEIIHRHYKEATRFFLLSESYFDLESKGGDFVLPLVSKREEDGFENYFKDDTKSNLIAGMIPKESKHKVEFLGGAVLSEGKLKGYLTESEMLALSFAGGFFAPRDISVEYPGDSESFVIIKLSQNENSKIKTFPGEYTKAKIEITLSGNYEFIPEADYKSFDKGFTLYLEKEIGKSVRSVIKKCIEQYDSDVLGLIDHAKIHFVKNADMERSGIELKDILINPAVTIKTERNGRFTFG